MQYLEEFVTLEIESNWSITRATISLLDNTAIYLRNHGWRRTAIACECAANRMRKGKHRA